MANKVPTPCSEQDLTPTCSSPPLLWAFFLPHKLWGTSAAAQCWWVPMTARGTHPTAPRGFMLGAMGLEGPWWGGPWGEKSYFMDPAQLWEGMVSGDEGTPGRLGARCEGLGTAGMDGGGTGKRDRQRVPRGKRRVRLFRPRKASSIRPG